MKAYSTREWMLDHDIVLVGCSSEKWAFRDVSFPAADLYTGDLFEKAKALALELKLPWFILSAKHGVVPPDRPLRTYNVKLDDLTHLERQTWGLRVALALQDTPRNRVLCLAGFSYWQHVPGAEQWHTPLKGLGIGQQKQRLVTLLEEVKSRPVRRAR